MNRNLFGMNNRGPQRLVYALIVLLVLVAAGFGYAFAVKKDRSFLLFHGHKDYNALNEKNAGFYGKVNYLLEKALEKKAAGAYKIDKLDAFYPALDFYAPADTDYVVAADDIRLIDFRPDSGKDAEFYYNSDFKRLIELQNRNLTQKYFNIQWNAHRDSILAITIDTTLYKLSLWPDSWKGRIDFADPFNKVDTNVAYIHYGGNVIPLLSSGADTVSWARGELGLKRIFVNENRRYSAADFQDHSSVQILWPSVVRGREPYIRLLNAGGYLRVSSHGVDLDVRSDSNRWTSVGDTAMALAPHFSETIVTARPRSGVVPVELHLFSAGPFISASKPMNAGLTNERLDMDKTGLDLFSRQELTQVATAMPTHAKADTLRLTTNIVLSRYLEDRMREKVNSLVADKSISNRPDDVYEISMCLMDMSTGEVIAAPFYSNEFAKNNTDELTMQRNFNLIRHDIGSTFKPLLSYAAALKFPSLAQFKLLPGRTHVGAETDTNLCTLMGFTTGRYGYRRISKKPNALFWAGGPIGRRDFLIQSYDNYPIALSLLALTEDGDTELLRELNAPTLNNERVNNLVSFYPRQGTRLLGWNNPSTDVKQPWLSFKDCHDASFVNLMSWLYDVSPDTKIDERTRNIILYNTNPWSALRGVARLDGLYEDQVSLNAQVFGDMDTSRLANFGAFRSFVLGQGDNQWTNIQLAQAYARLLSKTDVHAAFTCVDSVVRKPLYTDSIRPFDGENASPYHFKVTPALASGVWDAFMNDWEAAVKSKSGKLLEPAYGRFQETGMAGQLSLFCKTGTPIENDKPNVKIFKKRKKRTWWDEGLFAFAICDRHDSLPRGITGVVYIKHLSLSEIRGKGVESSTARDFLTTDVWRKMLFYNQNRFK